MERRRTGRLGGSDGVRASHDPAVQEVLHRERELGDGRVRAGVVVLERLDPHPEDLPALLERALDGLRTVTLSRAVRLTDDRGGRRGTGGRTCAG